MNKLYSILILLFGTLSIDAQKPDNYCGTHDKSPWLTRYQANKNAFSTRNSEVLYIPLTIHNVGNDGTGGYFSFNGLMKALCTLNNDFLDSDIQFFIEGEINYINNSSWSDHESFGKGREMMNMNNIDETINCYIVENPAGNCGYSSYGLGIALSTNCIGPNDHTWAHELGHFLSLPHTFYGWEGGVSEDEPKPNYNEAAPEIVYVHGQAIQVEKVDGSNCNDAADGFCDTPPDYIFGRWTCNSEGKSNRNYIDPNGDTFTSDGTFFMSYSNDDCTSRFSLEQTEAMRANAIDNKKYYTSNEINLEVISDSPQLLSPIDSAETFPIDVLLEWEPVEHGEHYRVFVSRYKSFSNLAFQGTTDNNFIKIPNLKKNKRYYWKIYPWSKFSFCNEFTEAQQFVTSLIVANDDIQNESNISVFPNLITNQQPIRIKTNNDINSEFLVQIIDITGKSIFSQEYGENSQEEIQVTTQNLNSGLYFISIKTEKETFIEKIIVK